VINAEKFKKEILAMMDKNDRFAIDNKNVLRKCVDLKCSECLFGEGLCYFERMKWLLSEHKEPIKVSKLEYDILKYLSDNTVHMYIVRDGNGNICLYDAEPKKSGNGDWWVGRGVHGMVMFDKLFQFIKWEDSTPTLIKDVLENCEVVNDAEE
jgi:hypothetical protein